MRLAVFFLLIYFGVMFYYVTDSCDCESAPTTREHNAFIAEAIRVPGVTGVLSEPSGVRVTIAKGSSPQADVQKIAAQYGIGPIYFAEDSQP